MTKMGNPFVDTINQSRIVNGGDYPQVIHLEVDSTCRIHTVHSMYSLYETFTMISREARSPYHRLHHSLKKLTDAVELLYRMIEYRIRN